ncbi:chromate transporter [Paraburkholderia sediminicola]|uniref:chromate transporter n=1 Tax=Paraburkholderia sediminicola TaxID=458836 RepID=UPI0038B7EBB3
MSNARVGLLRLGLTFVLYANLTFGGGSATVATIRRAIVERNRWLPEEDFSHVFAIARLTPGTNRLAFCCGIGWLLRGWRGAVVTLLAASIPCAVITAAVMATIDVLARNALFTAGLRGAMATAVGVTAVTCWTIVKPHVSRATQWRVLVVAAAALVAQAVLPPFYVLLAAGAVGFLFPRKT